jgi:hypothetical protein
MPGTQALRARCGALTVRPGPPCRAPGPRTHAAGPQPCARVHHAGHPGPARTLRGPNRAPRLTMPGTRAPHARRWAPTVRPGTPCRAPRSRTHAAGPQPCGQAHHAGHPGPARTPRGPNRAPGYTMPGTQVPHARCGAPAVRPGQPCWAPRPCAHAAGPQPCGQANLAGHPGSARTPRGANRAARHAMPGTQALRARCGAPTVRPGTPCRAPRPCAHAAGRQPCGQARLAGHLGPTRTLRCPNRAARHAMPGTQALRARCGALTVRPGQPCRSPRPRTHAAVP